MRHRTSLPAIAGPPNARRFTGRKVCPKLPVSGSANRSSQECRHVVGKTDALLVAALRAPPFRLLTLPVFSIARRAGARMLPRRLGARLLLARRLFSTRCLVLSRCLSLAWLLLARRSLTAFGARLDCRTLLALRTIAAAATLPVFTPRRTIVGICTLRRFPGYNRRCGL